MNEPTRYALGETRGFRAPKRPIMRQDILGPYVRWDDHCAIVATQKRLTEARMAEIDRLKKEIDRLRWLLEGAHQERKP